MSEWGRGGEGRGGKNKQVTNQTNHNTRTNLYLCADLKKVNVKQSCEASDLIWENLAIGIWDRRFRQLMGYVLCFGLILGCFFMLVWVCIADDQDPFGREQDVYYFRL